jgi:hypothetical protein
MNALNEFELHPAIQNMPNKNSSGDVWIEWFKILKRAMGKKQASAIWLKAWYMRAGTGSSASTASLRTYMSEQGIDIDKTTAESIGDTVSSGADFVGDFLKTGTWIGVGLLAVIAVGIGVAVLNIAKKSGTIASDVAKGYSGMGGIK